MRRSILATIYLLTVIGGIHAQATQPSESGALEIRASEAFDRGEYTIALPLLEKLASGLQDEPERLDAVQEKIRVCQKNLEPTDPQADATLRPPDAPPTAEQRKAHPEPQAGEVLELTIKDLGNFEYDPETGGNIPADVLRLSGSQVKLSGFMIPIDQADNITQFALVPDLFACCFGQPPTIQHTVLVNCPEGKSVAYFPDQIAVEGTLKVEEKKDDGYIINLFELDVTSVRPAAK